MKTTNDEIMTRKIRIVSGEGEIGYAVDYTGKDTDRAIKSRLTRERCSGDRWAKAVVYDGISQYDEEIGYDFETGEPCSWPSVD